MPSTERLTGALSENLITLLSQSDEHGKLVASIVDPNLFEGELRIMAERCISYWRLHGEAPKMHTADLFADILEDPRNRRAGTYRRMLEAMVQLNEGINAKYVLGELKTFARLQKLKDAILRAGETLQASNETSVQAVEEILATILHARDFQFDAGIRLSEFEKLLSYLEVQYVEFDTGIKQLDRAYIVPARGTMFNLLGASGKGKTWGMVQLGKMAYLRRKKVLHISPEVSAEDVVQRYYQSIFSVSKRGEKFVIPKLKYDKFGLTGIERQTLTTDFNFDSPVIRDELTTRRELYPRLNNIVVKRVAPRSLTPNGVNAMLDSLENVEGFVPDMVIFDSAYLMKTDVKDHRIGLGRAYEELRGVFVDRNVAGVVSHQISKEGALAATARQTHVAEDWSIVQTADVIITLSVTDAEQRYGLARLYADKVRHEAGGVGVLITQAYSIGQFALDSTPLKPDYFDYLENLSEEDFESDEG